MNLSIQTMHDVFDAALEIERSMMQLYDQLSRKFVEPSVASYFMQLAKDEAQHIQWLSKIRDQAAPALLETRPTDEIIDLVRRTYRDVGAVKVDEAASPQQIYELVRHIENNETILLVNFLMENFTIDSSLKALIRSQLRRHEHTITQKFPYNT